MIDDGDNGSLLSAEYEESKDVENTSGQHQNIQLEDQSQDTDHK